MYFVCVYCWPVVGCDCCLTAQTDTPALRVKVSVGHWECEQHELVSEVETETAGEELRDILPVQPARFSPAPRINFETSQLYRGQRSSDQ